MKKVVLILASTLLVATSFTSCKKDCPVDDPTRTELLTAEEWIGVDVVEYLNDIEEDTHSIVNQKWAFINNFDVISYTNDEPDDIWHWRFANNGESIEFLDSYDSVDGMTFNIDKLTATQLMLSDSETDGSDTYTIVYSFTH